jgi:cobalt-zinc-cadmium efflux system protein
MSSGHSHALPENKSESTLWIALGLATTFLIAEVVAGLLLNSLALLADAAFNALKLFGAAIYILYEAWQRFRSAAEVQYGGMLVVAVLGLVINLISMRLLAVARTAA